VAKRYRIEILDIFVICLITQIGVVGIPPTMSFSEAALETTAREKSAYQTALFQFLSGNPVLYTGRMVTLYAFNIYLSIYFFHF